MSGAWIYNWLDKRYQWVINGKAYTSPDKVPSDKTQRPYHDPGVKVIKSKG